MLLFGLLLGAGEGWRVRRQQSLRAAQSLTLALQITRSTLLSIGSTLGTRLQAQDAGATFTRSTKGETR